MHDLLQMLPQAKTHRKSALFKIMNIFGATSILDDFYAPVLRIAVYKTRGSIIFDMQTGEIYENAWRDS
jgi:hypothetical protein